MFQMPLQQVKGCYERQKLQAKLDEMTQAVAKVENWEGQYKSFSDVINFNDSTDVLYSQVYGREIPQWHQSI